MKESFDMSGLQKPTSPSLILAIGMAFERAVLKHSIMLHLTASLRFFFFYSVRLWPCAEMSL